jgi:signal transduction histidine kinase
VGEAFGTITVSDDGKGFAPRGDAAQGQAKAGRGLSNMQNRAASCGAVFELISGNDGTRVRLKLPRRFPDGDAVTG